MLARALRPRVLVYAALLAGAAGAFTVSVAQRSPFLLDVVKDRAALGQATPDGTARNVYRLQVMNRSEALQHLQVSASGPPGLQLDARELQVPAALPSLRWWSR